MGGRTTLPCAFGYDVVMSLLLLLALLLVLVVLMLPLLGRKGIIK